MASPFEAPISLACNLPTFRTAADSYLQNGGEHRYLSRIIEHFGDQPLASIAPFDVKQMCLALYPTHSNATRNRCALTPARAVLSHDYDRGWYWAHVDLARRSVLLLKTKTTKNSTRGLTDVLVKRLHKLGAEAEAEDHVFGYSSRYSINDRIKAVCVRAGISYKTSHACGRHSFATNAIAMGLDIKTVMTAADWKTAEMFMRVYVHVQNAPRVAADRFNGIEFDVL